MEWIQAVIAQFTYIDDGTFCVWESHRILGILRENVKHASTERSAVTRGAYHSERGVQRDRDQSPKSWGTRQRHAKPKVVEDEARAGPGTTGLER
jgi:hypothetical protein